MNIKILQEYLGKCNSKGIVGTPQGFYRYIEENYIEELKKININIIIKFWSNSQEEVIL